MTSANNSKIDGVVGVIRTSSSEYAYRLAKAWDETSITQIEVTMTVPNALQVIEKLLGEGVTRLGGGTVRIPILTGKWSPTTAAAAAAGTIGVAFAI